MQTEFYISLGSTLSPYRPDKWNDKLAESMPDHHRTETRQMSLYDANLNCFNLIDPEYPSPQKAALQELEPDRRYFRLENVLFKAKQV